MIWHIALKTDWVDAQASGEYCISTRGKTLDEVGYIHCSKPEQLEGVAQRFYSDLSELLLLEIDPNLVDANIIEEPLTPGSEEEFPHIYGPLQITAVRSVRQWTKSETAWQIPGQSQDQENATSLSEPFSA